MVVAVVVPPVTQATPSVLCSTRYDIKVPPPRSVGAFQFRVTFPFAGVTVVYGAFAVPKMLPLAVAQSENRTVLAAFTVTVRTRHCMFV